MGDSTLLPLVISAFGGAFLALVGEGFFKKWADARTAKALAAALWEELSATYIGLFATIARTLPETLSRDIMRYHWRVKILFEDSTRNGAIPKASGEASKEMWEGLISRLESFNALPTLRLTIRPSEARDARG